MCSLPVADLSMAVVVVVTITLIGVIDDPPDIITTTSTCPDDSEPMYRPFVNCTTNTTHI